MTTPYPSPSTPPAFGSSSGLARTSARSQHASGVERSPEEAYSQALEHLQKQRRTPLAEFMMRLPARPGAVAIETAEEERLLRSLQEILFGITSQRGAPSPLFDEIYYWAPGLGLVCYRRADLTGTKKLKAMGVEGVGTFPQMLEKVRSLSQPGPISLRRLYMLSEVHQLLQHEPELARPLRDLAVRLRHSPTSDVIVLVGSDIALPPDLQRLIPEMRFPRPRRIDLRLQLQSIFKGIAEDFEIQPPPDTYVEKVAAACLGLTELETRDAVRMGLFALRRFDEGLLAYVTEAKKAAIRRAGALEAVDVHVHGLADVGGLGALSTWVRKRRVAFTEVARQRFVDAPKGVLLTGVPGTGKSRAAQAIAAELAVPLFRLDMGSVFGGLVGDSERNIRTALATVESLAPCVLQIDEMEKGLSGAGGSGSSDGGTSSRVLGYILTWMQEKREPVFVVATSNDLSRMPPELLRKGRFDEVFWLGFPTLEERLEILRIHLAKRSLEISDVDQQRVAENTEGFTGAEIEALVAEANLAALNEGRERVSVDDLVREAEATVPMLVTQWEKISRDLERARSQGMRRASGSGTQVRLRDVVERYKSRPDLFLDDDGGAPEFSESFGHETEVSPSVPVEDEEGYDAFNEPF